MTGALPSGTEISKGIKEQEPKSVFEVFEHVGKLAKHITQLCDDRGGPARVTQVKRDLPQVGRQSSLNAQKRGTLVRVQSLE